MDTGLTNFIGGAFIFVGIMVGLFLLRKLMHAYSSKSWKSVSGQLTSSDLRVAVYKGRDSNGGADEASALVVNFSYSYEVDGRAYNGRRVTYSDHVNKTTGSLYKIQKMYKGKSEITVYYDPLNPSNSVLIPGPTVYNYTPFITATLFVVAGYYIINLV